ncbi:LPXTG cell wall anchor domain-containing protein [Lacticaseibacillus sp. GG6-2]
MSVIPATLSRTVLAFGLLCFSALALILCNVLLYRTIKGKDRHMLSGFRAVSVLVVLVQIIIAGVASQNWWFTLVGLACALVLFGYLLVTYRKRTLK